MINAVCWVIATYLSYRMILGRLAALEANGFVSFSDNVELASTEAAITLDGTPCEGAYDIVYTATDSCGNTTTSSQRIVLEDTVDPILTVETPEPVTLSTVAPKGPRSVWSGEWYTMFSYIHPSPA